MKITLNPISDPLFINEGITGFTIDSKHSWFTMHRQDLCDVQIECHEGIKAFAYAEDKLFVFGQYEDRSWVKAYTAKEKDLKTFYTYETSDKLMYYYDSSSSKEVFRFVSEKDKAKINLTDWSEYVFDKVHILDDVSIKVKV